MLTGVRSMLFRLKQLLYRRSIINAEQDEEFQFHLDMQMAENRRLGMTEREARRSAVLRFGGMQRFREESNDARGVVAIDRLLREVRFATRRLVRARAFTAGVIATLGIGIGAAVGIGSMVYGVLLRDLPYRDPDQLVRVGFHIDGNAEPGELHSEATFLHFAESARSFSALGAYYTNDAINITDGDIAERVTAAMITPSVLTLLGARPLLGELFMPGDTSWSGDQLPVLLSENLWRRRFGASPAIIGRRIDINRGSRVVMGILPRSFDFPVSTADVYYPAAVRVDRPQIAARYFHVVGRLRNAVTPSEAEAELRTLVPSIASRFPAITAEELRRTNARASVTDLRTAIVAPVRPQLVVLGVLVGVVLLIAATNVVNLFLLRSERAAPEIAVAFSLGATRAAVAQRFVVEGILLGLASAVVALPATAMALAAKFGFTEREIPRLDTVSFTWKTVGITIGCALIIGAAVGLTALTRIGVAGLSERLRGSRATASRRWRKAQHAFVTLQVAMALTLLVAAGLLGRSFMNLKNAEIGFEPARAMSFQVSLPWNGYRTYAENAAFHASMMDRLLSLPGVSGVATVLRLPLNSAGSPGLDVPLRAVGGDGRGTTVASGNMASAQYFRVMGIELKAGRAFQPGDLRGTPAVILSERLAVSLFGSTDVVGRRIVRSGSDGEQATEYGIVGVVDDVYGGRIEEGHIPLAYFPLLRDGDGLPPDSAPQVPFRPRDVAYVIRGDPLPGAPAIREVVMDLDRFVPPTNIRSLHSLVDDATAHVRLTMLLIGVAGAAALLLGVVGVYSVVSYASAGRGREFAVRIALGAPPGTVGGMVLGDGIRLVVTGCVAGLIAAASGTRFLRALLYEVQPSSVPEFVLATGVLLVAAVVAASLPAWRAARTDPALVLRGE